MQLRDQPPDLRSVQLLQAARAEQVEQDGEVAGVDLQAARGEPPLVLERAEVVADPGVVRMRGASSTAAQRARLP